MMEWQISDQDIQAVEEILLPHGAQFPRCKERYTLLAFN